jgi:DNA invertase Pin-like site-specific DNA recombinase
MTRKTRTRTRPPANFLMIGYARTSTLDQQAGFEAQLRDLEAAGCTKLFQEQVSSVGTRPQLDACLDYVREGDTLVVTKLDRLARSTAHLLTITETIEAKGAALRILNLNLDTSTATGKLMLTMLGAVAEFERSMMVERQREGIAKAKAAGKYKGRAPTARAKAAQVHALQAEGVGPAEIARRLGIGRSSVYRVLGAA